MGVISLDSYCRRRWPNAFKYYTPGEKLTPYFKLFALDANPFVYSAAVAAFETDIILKQHEDKTYEDKIQMVFDFTWKEICDLIDMVNCDEIFIAFDSVAPMAKQIQQRQRRYPRSLPVDGEFDTTNISCGTKFMHDLCSFIEFKIQEINGWGKKVIFSGHTSPGEGEHKLMDYIKKLKNGTPVCMYGPDGDLYMLGLSCFVDFYLFKTDYATRNNFEKKMYTVRMKIIKDELSKPNTNFIGQANYHDYTKTFVFLGMFLGNDFVPRLEIFDVFINGIDDLYQRYNTLNFSLFKGNLQCQIFNRLLESLAKEEPYLLSKRTKYPWPLLEECTVDGKLDFKTFRSRYYSEWVHLDVTNEKQIEKMCHNYLSTIHWCWLYYTVTCPTPNHFYRYHYPPFCCDLAKYFKTWKIPKFRWPGKGRYPSHIDECTTTVADAIQTTVQQGWRTPFQQLVAVLPPNRKHLLPETFHHYFQGEAFPKLKNVVKNSQGKNEKFEMVLELPFFEGVVDVEDNRARNTLTGDRIFTPGEIKYKVKTKWGSCVTNLSG